MKNLVLILIILFGVSPAMADAIYQPPRFTDSNRIARIQKAIPKLNTIYQRFAKKNHIPGYVFGILAEGKLIYVGNFGYANLESKTPVTSNTVFRIASMSKSFTAAAILKLRDEGKLRLDDPVSQYIPEFDQQQLTHDTKAITIRDLLTHSAGLPEDDPWGDRQLSVSDKQLIKLLQQGVSFSNDSGTHYEYSNLAFATLGHIVTKVSGISYQAYIEKEIWQPLNMNHTAWEYSKVPEKNLAQGYQWGHGAWRNISLLHDGAFGAMGGVLTSVEDFSRYMMLYLASWPARDESDAGFIRRGSLREMQQPWRFAELDPAFKFLDGSKGILVSGYGYGLFWNRDENGMTIVGHPGGLPGFGSSWMILPDYDVGVVLLTNETYAPAETANLTALRSLVKAAHLSPRTLPASAILKTRQAQLMKLLPEWGDAENSSIFANNFFLDMDVATRRKATQVLFKQAGKILQVKEIVPENQLRGTFTMHGEHRDIKVYLALSPENPARIQTVEMKQISRN